MRTLPCHENALAVISVCLSCDTRVAELHAQMVGGTRVWNSPPARGIFRKRACWSSTIANEMRQSGWHPRCDASGMRNSPRQRVRLGMTVWLCVAAAAALHGQSSTSTSIWPIRDAPAELRPAISRGDVVISTMHDALLWELNSGLEQGGPVLAIKSCHVDSARVAERVGREEGLAAGRTSDRLRNPTNAPRPWAAPLVKANAGRRAQDVDGFAVDLGDKVGVIRPIAERATVRRLPWTSRPVQHRRSRRTQGPISIRPRHRLRRGRHSRVVLGRSTEAASTLTTGRHQP